MGIRDLPDLQKQQGAVVNEVWTCGVVNVEREQGRLRGKELQKAVSRRSCFSSGQPRVLPLIRRPHTRSGLKLQHRQQKRCKRAGLLSALFADPVALPPAPISSLVPHKALLKTHVPHLPETFLGDLAETVKELTAHLPAKSPFMIVLPLIKRPTEFGFATGISMHRVPR